jgi:uncharacterized protein YukE
MKTLTANVVTFGDVVLTLDPDQPLDALVAAAAFDLDYKLNALKDAVRVVANDTARAQEALENGWHVNAQVIYQTSAVRADQAAAAYEQALNTLKSAIWALKKTREAAADLADNNTPAETGPAWAYVPCDDCGAAPGEACHQDCSSNWKLSLIHI